MLLATIAAGTFALNAAWGSPGSYIPDPSAREKIKSQLDELGKAHEAIAPEVAKDTTFLTLMGTERWQHTNKSLRTDDDDKFKAWCMYGWFDAGKYNSYRAMNLAASEHYDEAIIEINRGIDAVRKSISEGKKRPHDFYNLTDYLTTRMKMFLAAGRISEAVVDAEELGSTQSKFPAAVCLLENGKTKEAEAIFATLVNNPQTQIFESVCRYMLAVCEEKNGKRGSAQADYLIAARYFAMSGREAAMQVCLENAGKFGAEKSKAKVTDLKRPETNKKTIYELVKFLTTEKNAFEGERLKEVLHADSFEKLSGDSLRFKFANPQATAINLIQVGPEERTKGGFLFKGRRLLVRIDTIDCSLTRDECSSLLAMDRISVPMSQLGEETGIVEAYKVPAGLLELTWYKGGFGSLYTLELFEGLSQHPDTANYQRRPSTEDDWYSYILRLLGDKKFADAKRSGIDWLKTSNSELAMRAQAKISAAEGNTAMALIWIDKAIAKHKALKNASNEPASSSILFMEKAEYLLGNRQIQAAANLFKSALPEKMLADDYALRAKIEIAQRNYPAALADLKVASEKYFEEFRIVKRDEMKELIASLTKRAMQFAK